MLESWTSRALAIELPAATAQSMCARGARRGGAAATFARRDALAARLVVWAPGAGGGAQPIGMFGMQWRAPGAGVATLIELVWPPTRHEADLWRAIEELAGKPIAR
jgi:hypothetical protein